MQQCWGDRACKYATRISALENLSWPFVYSLDPETLRASLQQFYDAQCNEGHTVGLWGF
jgi:hypothetical protein